MKTALSNQLPAALRVLLQFALLMGLSEFGSRLVAYLDLPLPGGVIGMLVLLFMLSTGSVKLQHSRPALEPWTNQG
jgi:putative effector of murein hydrolase LrgA (UPF0299 family)